MTSRQFEPLVPAKAKLSPAHRQGTPESGVALEARPDRGIGVARGGAPSPHGLAAALDRAGPGRLARAGSALLQLQRRHGNRYVQRVIGQVRANVALSRPNRGGAQRTAARPADGEVDGSLRRTLDAARGAGRPLDRKVGARLGQAFGTDFGQVKVHTDGRADNLSRSLGADAFTVGGDLFFRANRYKPSTPAGERLLAHELAHVVQHGANTRGASRLRLTPANDAYERAADRAADQVARDPRAQPPGRLARDLPVQAAAPRAPLIQRKAFIGANPAAARRAELEDPQTGATSAALGADVVEVPDDYDDLGRGERRVHTVVEDHRSRYFRDLNELYDYARRRTEEIGYVDREKTWVRLPKQFLVLGERHSGTTLMDLVQATGTERYLYEGGPTRPSPYLHPGEQVAEGAGRHALEEALPKLVVGLVGVEQALQPRLQALERLPGWKGRVRGGRRTAARADPEAAQLRYEADLAVWSTGWEAENKAAEARGERQQGVGARFFTGGDASDLLVDTPPNKPYSREAAEVAATRKALEALRAAARGNYDPITRFYTENQQVINKTIAQLNAGLPVHLTRMFLAMASDRFDLSGLIDLLTAAAEREFAASGAADVSKAEGYGRTYEKAAGRRAEQLRDSYMLHRILEAKAAGDRLAGLGDAHRQNLEGVLRRRDPEILVKRWTSFYTDQYRLHPDRE